MVEIFKFGGTCTATPDKLDRITEIIEDTSKPLIVTLSAAAGVTDLLKETLDGRLDENRIKQQVTYLKKRHENLLDNRFELPKIIEENLERLERLLYGVHYTEELTDRTFDLIMTFGERLIVPILKEYLTAKNIKTEIIYPENFIITNGNHTNSLVLLDQTEQKIKNTIAPLLSDYDVILVPGFYGISEKEVITLLGRSGTDYTASVLAYGLNADSMTIWKDVFGFMSADPRMVDNAHTIPSLSYQEAAELAYFGAKLLHPRAASPARLKHIPIYIRHIDYLDATTCINSDQSKNETTIKSVSHMTNLSIVKVFASVGGNTKGVLASIADKIKQSGGNTISVATSQTCIAFLMNENEATSAANEIETLGKEIVDNLEIKDNIALICIVGEGLAKTPGIAFRAFQAVSSKGINVDLISAGASAVAYHFTVDKSDLKMALELIHNQFFEENN